MPYTASIRADWGHSRKVKRRLALLVTRLAGFQGGRQLLARRLPIIRGGELFGALFHRLLSRVKVTATVTSIFSTSRRSSIASPLPAAARHPTVRRSISTVATTSISGIAACCNWRSWAVQRERQDTVHGCGVFIQPSARQEESGRASSLLKNPRLCRWPAFSSAQRRPRGAAATSSTDCADPPSRRMALAVPSFNSGGSVGTLDLVLLPYDRR